MEPNPYQSPAEIEDDDGAMKPDPISPPMVPFEARNEIWYATPAKVKPPMKLWALDDRGFVCATVSGFTFCGSNGNIQMPIIRSVSLTRQTPPWMLHLLISPLVITFCVVGNGSWLVAVGVILFFAAMGFFFALLMPWVKVEFTDNSGELRAAYFADGSQAGWGGILGGTHHLQRWIADVSNKAETKEGLETREENNDS